MSKCFLKPCKILKIKDTCRSLSTFGQDFSNKKLHGKLDSNKPANQFLEMVPGIILQSYENFKRTVHIIVLLHLTLQSYMPSSFSAEFATRLPRKYAHASAEIESKIIENKDDIT
jgi:hypothetical protein